jgi:glycosyltransferase involved in cell wall biosynthesis
MRVLLAVTGLGMGGAERMVRDLADALPAEVCIAYLKGPLDVRPRRAGVHLACLGVESARDLPPACLKLRRLLRDFHPDIVHGHMFHAALLTRLLRRAAPGARIISTMHTGQDGGPLRALALRLTDALADISTNVSHEAVDAFVASGAVPAGRMIAIHNGIDLQRYQREPDARMQVRDEFGIAEPTRLLFAAGRLDWSKDYPTLLQALALLRDSVDYRLLIAGDGPHRDDLTQLARTLGLEERVQFLGVRRDIPRLMSAADVFVLSSVGEAFGLVVAEAMACECVVVATDAGGVREVLGPAGMLVPTRDPAALAQALRAGFALDPGQAATMGAAARQRVVKYFSFEREIDAWMRLYEQLLEDGPDRSSQTRRLH